MKKKIIIILFMTILFISIIIFFFVNKKYMNSKQIYNTLEIKNYDEYLKFIKEQNESYKKNIVDILNISINDIDEVDTKKLIDRLSNIEIEIDNIKKEYDNLKQQNNTLENQYKEYKEKLYI